MAREYDSVGEQEGSANRMIPRLPAASLGLIPYDPSGEHSHSHQEAGLLDRFSRREKSPDQEAKPFENHLQREKPSEEPEFEHELQGCNISFQVSLGHQLQNEFASGHFLATF